MWIPRLLHPRAPTPFINETKRGLFEWKSIWSHCHEAGFSIAFSNCLFPTGKWNRWCTDYNGQLKSQESLSFLLVHLSSSISPIRFFKPFPFPQCFKVRSLHMHSSHYLAPQRGCGRFDGVIAKQKEEGRSERSVREPGAMIRYPGATVGWQVPSFYRLVWPRSYREG